MKTTYTVLAIYRWSIIELILENWKYFKLDKNNKTKEIDKKEIQIITMF